MKFFLISDNIDTEVGMRLAGIEGVVAHTQGDVNVSLAKAVKDPKIAVVLITSKLVKLCHNYIYEFKLKNKEPLIVEIPDRDSDGSSINAMSKYIHDAIGIKI